MTLEAILLAALCWCSFGAVSMHHVQRWKKEQGDIPSDFGWKVYLAAFLLFMCCWPGIVLYWMGEVSKKGDH